MNVIRGYWSVLPLLLFFVAVVFTVDALFGSTKRGRGRLGPWGVYGKAGRRGAGRVIGTSASKRNRSGTRQVVCSTSAPAQGGFSGLSIFSGLGRRRRGGLDQGYWSRWRRPFELGVEDLRVGRRAVFVVRQKSSKGCEAFGRNAAEHRSSGVKRENDAGSLS